MRDLVVTQPAVLHVYTRGAGSAPLHLITTRNEPIQQPDVRWESAVALSFTIVLFIWAATTRSCCCRSPTRTASASACNDTIANCRTRCRDRRDQMPAHRRVHRGAPTLGPVDEHGAATVPKEMNRLGARPAVPRPRLHLPGQARREIQQPPSGGTRALRRPRATLERGSSSCPRATRRRAFSTLPSRNAPARVPQP
jgi:hypothetical protein